MHGYGFEAVIAEFRALRASVLRMYEDTGATDLSEVHRFNEAIDEAITESMYQFAEQRGLLRQELIANATKNASLVAEIKERRSAEEKITTLFRRGLWRDADPSGRRRSEHQARRARHRQPPHLRGRSACSAVRPRRRLKSAATARR